MIDLLFSSAVDMEPDRRVIRFRLSKKVVSPFSRVPFSGDYPNCVVHDLVQERDELWAENISQFNLLREREEEIEDQAEEITRLMNELRIADMRFNSRNLRKFYTRRSARLWRLSPRKTLRRTPREIPSRQSLAPRLRVATIVPLDISHLPFLSYISYILFHIILLCSTMDGYFSFPVLIP